MPAAARSLTRALGVTGALAAAAQVGPAATWLPPVRRMLAPSLCGPMPPGSVAVTFDDGPHPDGTPAVLDRLDELGWRATFFVLGVHVRRHREIVVETARRGHELALHGDEHRYAIARTPAAVAADLRRAHDTLTETTGRPVQWWRPPYGVLSGPALIVARGLGLRPVLWSAWGRDWESVATPRSVVGEITRARWLDGGTILLHDSDATSAPGSWRTTCDALPLLADALARRRIVVAALAV
jgi:peptidoglycan-N-acetylglucosamine deacetylase